MYTSPSIKTYTALATLGGLLFLVHYAVERHDTLWLMGLYALAFLVYLAVLRTKANLAQIVGAALLIRLGLFFALPSLSDDVFRFIWDGKLIHAGLHPYSSTPDQLMNHDINIQWLDHALYERLNSPEYYTVYPPISQLIFWLCTFSDHLFVNVTLIRTLLLLFDLGNMYLLYRFFNPKKIAARLAIYALNPLVILELTGNLHFEGILLFCILLAMIGLQQRKWVQSALTLGLGIGLKLIPLMFLAALIKKTGWKNALGMYSMIGLIMFLIALPFLEWSFVSGLSQSILLFFNKFEFNAGLFFLLRGIGFYTAGFDIIYILGPALNFVSLALIIFISIRYVQQDTALHWLFSLIILIQLVFSTTVHPWYIIPLIGLSLIGGYVFPIVWSGVIFFSYAGYTAQGYEHPVFWLAVEYVAMAFFAWQELINQKTYRIIHV